MPRPIIITDDLLLAVAREVFLEKGLSATTAEISKRAGVSHGIIFKRFKTKQALFHAAMNAERGQGSPPPLIDLTGRVGVGTVQDTLIDLGNMLVQRFFCVVPTMMMDWSNSRQETSDEAVKTACAQMPERVVRGLHHIVSYLEQEGKIGRVRHADYETLARIFVGACWHYVFLEVLMGENHDLSVPQDRYMKNVVSALWDGISPL